MANKRTRSQAKGAASKTPEARNESGAGAESSSHGINNSHSASSSSSMSALIGTLTNHTASSSSPSAPTPHPTLSTSSSSSASSSQGGRSAQEPSSIGSGHTIDLSTAGLPQVVACVTCFARPVLGSIVCVPCAEAQVQRLQAGARAQEEIKVSSSSAGSFSMSAEALQWAIGRTAVASSAPPTSVVSHGLVMPLAQDPSFSHSGNHRFGSSASIPASSGLVRPAAASGKREVLDSANDESSEWWGEATSSHLFPYISSTTLSKMRARKFVPLEAFVPTDEVAAASRHNSVKLTDQLFLSTGAVIASRSPFEKRASCLWRSSPGCR